MKYIIANWKSHKNLNEVRDWFDQFENVTNEDQQVIIAPSSPFLSLVSELKPQNVGLAVQDISPFPAGAYTGAVSAVNLQIINVGFAIVGHSERRRYFHETHQDVANKVRQCVENNITPIVCVDDEYIVDQATAIDKDLLAKCIVAYEELGAIGTGHNQPIDHVLKINQLIATAFGSVPIIYGGSVVPQNAKDYLQNTDGVLVGGASLDAKEFSQITLSI